MSEEANVEPAAEAPAEFNWREEAGVADNPRFENFKSVADLAKSYTELESYRGSSVRIPSEDAGEEVWQEFDEKLKNKVPNLFRMPEEPNDELYSRLGRPGDPADYQFQEIDGFEDDVVTQAEFAKVAHEAGLSNKQANAVREWLATNIVEEANQGREDYQQKFEQLKSEWGHAYESNLDQAKAAVRMLNDDIPGFSDYLDETGNGNDPMFIRMAHALATKFGEKDGIPARPAGVMDPHEARLQAAEMRNNPDHPYNNELDPGHKAAKEKMIRLYKLANP